MKKIITSFFIILIILNILLIIDNVQKSNLLLNIQNINSKLYIDNHDYDNYIKENIRLTNMNTNKLQDLFQSSSNQTISYIIMIPNGACSGCINTLLEETYINNLPKKQTYIISESPNDWLKRELNGNKFQNYYCDTTFFQNFEFKENIVVVKYLKTQRQLHSIIYVPEYSEFVEYFIQ